MKVALVGFGLAGETFHAPLIEDVEGLDLVAVVTSDPARAARSRAAHPGARVVATVDEASQLAELLVVATPNRHHVPIALAALERGLAVVVDKPLATTAAEAERLLAVGGRLTVFQNRRWDDDFMTVQRLLADGALGAILRFESRFERFDPEVANDWREHAGTREGGGCLLDLGSHLVDQARLLFGPPISVYAEIECRRPGAEVDDDVFIALEHPAGVRSHLWMSLAAPLGSRQLAISGVEAGFETVGFDEQERQLASGLGPGDKHFGRRGPGRLAGRRGSSEHPLEVGNYRQFYVGVRDWLLGDAPVPVDPTDAVAVLRILEAARRSAKDRTVVPLTAPQ